MNVGATGGFTPGEVSVRVPATSANLGPGFDALGLALDLYDEVSAEVLPDGGALEILVEGEGAGAHGVPRDATHLVHRSMVAAFERLGVATPGLRISCRNVIPHSRGLGSSAAAIVSGLALARALVADSQWSDTALFQLAAELEGHPDNVAPAVFGGFTVAFAREDEHGDHGGFAAVPLPVHPELRLRVLVPPTPVSTSVARGLLPAQVPHTDAAHNAGRAALLVAAVTHDPDLLLDATEDRLHQDYRAPALGETAGVVARLRTAGLAAVVSGAGPTVLVLSRAGDTRAEDLGGLVPAQWWVRDLAVGGGVTRLR